MTEQFASPAVNEGSPLNAGPSDAAAGGAVLVLSPHAKMGRQVSTFISIIFLAVFHGALLWISVTHGGLPCEKPLAGFLSAAGAVGIAGSLLYAYLELKRSRDDSMLLPSEVQPPVGQSLKLFAAVTLVAAVCVAVSGAVLYNGAPRCAYTSPVVYNWAGATLLLYVSFGGLVLLVPMCSAIFPCLAMALMPLIALLVAFAQWLQDAGRRGAYGAASVLTRWLRLGSATDAVAADAPTIANPAPTFALYVNTAALVWLFAYMLLEVVRGWSLPCDAPLATFVVGAAVLGLGVSLVDFLGDIFKDPMPPVTKAEQSRAADGRKRKLAGVGWLLAVVVVWGAMGVVWLNGSTTCAHTAPGVYRLAALLTLCYSLLVGLGALMLLALGVDYCLSGKLRVVVLLEQ